MQAVILAAGKGTRLKPLTDTIPKPLVPFREKPILDHTIRALPDTVDEIFIVVGHLGDRIREYVQSFYPDYPIRFIPQCATPGTYGALISTQAHLHDRFLVLNGDDVYEKSDLQALLHHERALGLQWHPMFGYHHHTVENGWLTGFVKNHPDTKRLTITGAYLLDEQFFELEPRITKSGEFGIPQTLYPVVQTYPVRAVEFSSWLPINTHEDLQYAEKNFTIKNKSAVGGI